MESHDHFRAMDTDIDMFIEAPEAAGPGAFIGAKLLFEQQEQRFSRFRPDSLLCRLNRGEVIDDPWFARAISMAIDAFELTGGYFNPMILPALERTGYDRSFSDLEPGGEIVSQRVPDPKLCLRLSGMSVALLQGQVDLGGIIKGWTADLAVEHLAEEHPNAFVNAGGDIRCMGSDAGGGGWAIDVSPPGGSAGGWQGRLTAAIATSTTLKRRWKTASGVEAHHVIDPGTGMPSDSPFVQVSARSDACWVAEAWAKAVLIGGEPLVQRAERSGVPVLAFTASGVMWANKLW